MSDKKELKTIKGPGGPEFTDEQYEVWLAEMRPHLVLGCSIHRALEKAGLLQHKDSIYKRARANPEFLEKIDTLRATPGENVNEAFVRLITQITDKVKREESLSRQEVDIIKHFSEKHRTAQPFFVSRTETADAKDEDFGKVVEPASITIVVPDKADKAPEKKTDDQTKEQSQDTKAENQLPTDDKAMDGVASATQ